MKKLAVLILILAAVLTLVLPVLAATEIIGESTKTEIDEQSAAFITAAGFSEVSLAQIVSWVIYAFLSVLGVIFIILIIYAGFLWLTSAGNEEKIKKAKDTMLAAIIGLIIIFSAWAITMFVFDRLIFGGTGSQPGFAGSPAYPD